MASWTPQYSTVLSLLLDSIVGTREKIDIRQDQCKILEGIQLTFLEMNTYYTGSRGEGLELPGSDVDFMQEINTKYNINVMPSIDENTNTSPFSTFLMVTENIRPAFALLQHVPQTPLDLFLNQACQNKNGLLYLSSDVFVQNRLIHYKRSCRAVFSKTFNDCITFRRQGPSKEMSSGISDSETGDLVDCIHCAFWPSEASEWRDRPRHFGWPTEGNILYITNFGFHLVPIGHPHSDTKAMEWRISFSIAERVLVWSFNHIQMQCYALMKIILKQFIKVRCTPQNQVLCSYFIKTFLFWKYETTNVNFWRPDNLRECMRLLLSEFSKCLRDGVLRHYFIPRFNLLSVKLTPAAQRELLQLFDIIIESDISILKYCGYLQEMWSTFLQIIVRGNEMIEHVIRLTKSVWNCFDDECMSKNFEMLNDQIGSLLCWYPLSVNKLFCQILSLSCKTPLQDLVLKCVLLNIHINSATDPSNSRNKYVYRLKQTSQFEMCSFDISSCKLWYAILLYVSGDYQSILNIINQVLSSIPPYAMHRHVSRNHQLEQMTMYRDVFLDFDLTIIQKAKEAWMFQMIFPNGTIYPLPLAIKIEGYFHIGCISLSPFTCAYYLQFLCYFDLRQYENRDRALEHLVEFAKDAAEHHNAYSDLNIAGHCLLLAGKIAEARDIFRWSFILTQQFSQFRHIQNSAQWYLLTCFEIENEL